MAYSFIMLLLLSVLKFLKKIFSKLKELIFGTTKELDTPEIEVIPVTPHPEIRVISDTPHDDGTSIPGGFRAMADHGDFPDIYVDGVSGGDGSLATPYTNLSDVNWTTSGDNSIFDYLAGTPLASPTIHLAKAATWRETMTVGCSGTATYPIIITSYGEGADPIINGADIIETWGDSSEEAVLSYTPEQDGTGDYCFRTAIPGDTASNDGDKIQVDIPANTVHDTTVTDCYIGEKAAAGDAFDMETETITQITFDVGGTGCTILAGEVKTSDWITYDFDKTKDYIISLGTTSYYRFDLTSGVAHYKAGDQANAGTADVSDYTETTNTYIKVFRIQSAIAENVWAAACTTEPNIVFFNGTQGENVASIILCNGANKWFWEANILYVYSTEDPDTAYVDPGIEASARTPCIQLAAGGGRDYITIDGLHLKYGNRRGINGDNTANNLTVCNCTIEKWGDLQGILPTGSNNTIYNNTITGGTSVNYPDSGVYCTGSGTNTIYNNIVSFCNAGLIIRGTQTSGSIYNNTIHDISDETDPTAVDSQGIELTGDGGQVTGVSIYGNNVYDCAGAGIAVHEASDNNIYYNLVYNCSSEKTDEGSIAIWSNSDGCKVLNNVVYNSGGDGIQASTGNDNPIVKNNIVHTAADGLRLTGTGEDNDYNCVYNISGTAFIDCTKGAHSIELDPLMIDPGNGDFHLNPHSPCVNAGTDVSLTEDYEGLKIRHAPDIGAHENQANALFFAWNLFRQWWY